MKKKILLAVLLVMLFVCLFAVSASAETDLKPQDNNNYGELSIFDSSITIGRTDTTNGYTPYKADGESYARVVIGDGTTFYTFPTYYILSKNGGEDYGKIPLFQHDFTSLNAAMETATGTNPGWTKANVYRIELPESIVRLNGGNQNFYGFSNAIEIYLPPNTTTIDTASNINCLFHSCEKLTTIHNIDSFLFKHNNNLSGSFQNCKSLTTLTLGVSPNITKINNSAFNNCTNLVSVNALEAFPNATEIGNNTFINCYKLTTISSSRNDGVIVLNHTYIDTNAFQHCDSIKAIKFTASSIKILQASFHSLDNLEYVYFPKTATLNLPSCEVFSNNEKLKAVAFPDNCTVIPDRGFKNCKTLKAVYLPANLDELKTNGGDQGAFSSCYELYFVQEWFDVLDENGEFLFENFEMPTRPDVYFFPSQMTKFYTRDEGTGFYKNYKLNPVMVLPETVTKLWVLDGCFYDCGEKGDTFTIVCLGDMTDIRIGLRENRAKGVSYLLANANDVDLSAVNIVDTNAGYNPSLNGNEYVYFCASTKCFKLFNLGGSNDDTQFTNDNVTYETATFKHVSNPNATVSVDATCETNKVETTYCFCEALIGTAEVENTALGHNHDLENGATLITITYADFTKTGYKEIKCSRCENVNKETTVNPFIIYDGYSVDETTKSIFAIGFRIDKDAIDAYEEATGNTLTFGVIGVLTDNLTEKDEGGNVVNTFKPLDAPSTVPVIKATVPETVTAFNLKIRGFNTDEYRALDITMSALVTVTDAESNENTVYIQSEQVESPSAYSVAQYIIDNTPVEEVI